MNIIITGASRGIGFEMAMKFAETDGTNIIAIARNESRLKTLEKECSKLNSKAHLYPIPFDLESNNSFTEFLLPQILNIYNSIDIIINNAGYLISKPFQDFSEDEILKQVNVNLVAPVKLIQCFLPLMNKGGHVVNISSMGGFQGSQKFAGLSVYSSAKAGLACLTECLAEEYKAAGIAFNCLAIGAVDTEMLQEAFPGYKPPFTAKVMADFIVDFALNKSKLFNGKVIPVSISTP